jgi:hypothetical protein
LPRELENAGCPLSRSVILVFFGLYTDRLQRLSHRLLLLFGSHYITDDWRSKQLDDASGSFSGSIGKPKKQAATYITISTSKQCSIMAAIGQWYNYSVSCFVDDGFFCEKRPFAAHP